MPNLNTLDKNNTDIDVVAILHKTETRLGKVSNMIKAMANSPIVAEIYLSIQEQLAKGKLTTEMKELIALTVAEENTCDYCFRAHAARGSKVGISIDDIQDTIRALNKNKKIEMALLFSKELIKSKATNKNVDINMLRSVGWSDGEIAEIIAVASLNVFPNYFNKINDTLVDFPEFKKASTK